MNDLFRQQQETGCSNSSCWSPTKWWGDSRGEGNDEPNLEADLAKEMNQLSFQERGKVLEDIHGVADAPEETPKFRAKSIADFDLALSQLFKRQRKALDRAIFLKPTIQTDDEFKLWFLRAECFNAARAANRMAAFFEQKLWLFGEEKLVKDITQDDVTDHEIELGAELIGTLSQRDRSGRPVRVGFPNKVDHNAPVKSLLRGGWYQTMALLDEDENASTKGMCQILFSPGPGFKSESISRIAYVSLHVGAMIDCLPVRISSYHFCYNNPALKVVLAAINPGIDRQIRVRMRTHFGSPIEMKYSLLTYGIDCGNIIDSYDARISEIPVDVIDTEFLSHRKQYERRQEEKRLDEEAISGLIEYPNPNDVLVGRGHYFASHGGNRRYHALVDSKLDLYNQSNNRFLKTAMSTEIVNTIRKANGRFLKPADGGWEVVDDVVAREKTAIAFRSSKKRCRSA